MLETGVTDQSIELFEWRALVEQGNIEEARRSAAVILLDAAGETAARWEFREAWPSQYEAPRLSATADEVAIERLVVAHEGFGRSDFREQYNSNEEGTGSVVNLPKGELPRSTWTPQGVDESNRLERRSVDATNEESEET